MSRGSDGRETRAGQNRQDDRERPGTRSSRTSVRMTVERARAIQSHADRTGTQQDFKARAQSAAARNAQDSAEDGE
ncbi:hypothetical protein ACN28I_04605 [Archangium gephyra]|uniref:hypothetical protein n=1 Tax=Archangium gephyra TaxID=48 RepID=UPI003B7CE914